MIIESADIYFNQELSTHAATITGITGAVYGYYTREYVEVNAGRTTIAGFKPTFTCSAAVVASVESGTAVSISGITETFTVAHIEKRDEIESRLILEEA